MIVGNVIQWSDFIHQLIQALFKGMSFAAEHCTDSGNVEKQPAPW